MSQTETILLVVLGFSLASLIALFIGRLMWRVAIRIGVRRMQRQVPSSLVGLQTERDRLRAEYAMLAQRLGSRLEAVTLKMAEHMAEVSRHRNRIVAMEQSAAVHDDLATRLQARVGGLEAELAAAAAREVELRQALAAQEDRLRQAAQPPQAASEAIAMPAPQPAPRMPPDSADRLRQRIGKLNELADEVAHERGEPSSDEEPAATAPHPDPAIVEKLAEAERQTAELQKELETLDAEWTRRLEEAGPQAAAAEDAATPVANVISLAARIRDLKKGLANN